ncbi:heparinase II/III family protein [Pontiellaceae bacterium B12227]|nr:heparinase II/III family protein [Pontiellaceae bacterium B12227]
MKKLGVLAVSFILAVPTFAQQLDDCMSLDYLNKHLRKEHPRLVYTPELVEQLQQKVKTDPVIGNMYAAIQLNAEKIYKLPLSKRKLTGRRLLGVSRETLYRMNMLGVVYLVEGDARALDRINDELLAVSTFENWNPKHFLDVAEMSLAVSLALDWTAGALPESTVKIASQALLDKGLLADGKPKARIVSGDNNWNQVCNGGMIAASITLADTHPELAASTIQRALAALPNALKAYMPNGVYPEGSTYWGYATRYSITTAAMLESAFGHDFGHQAFPGFMESAVFRLLCTAPSGLYYNYADCGDKRSSNGDVALAWFAAKTGNQSFFEKERFLRDPKAMGTLSRLTGAGMAWLSQYEEQSEEKVPTAWKGDGSNPIVIFTGGNDDGHHYYFGGKGGKATTSHGNMDAGSFVFELNGVRWVVDPGNQSYHALEKTGFNLWDRKQNSDRWTLLNKNNFGHSTITVNGELFVNEGFAPLVDFKGGKKPMASFDLTAVYGPNLKQALRTFTKDSPVSLLIEDELKLSEQTETIVWQLVTTAEVKLVAGGAVLRSDDQVLKVENLSHPQTGMSVVALDPPPMELDRIIPGLKRLELTIPATAASDGSIRIRVRLTAPE